MNTNIKTLFWIKKSSWEWRRKENTRKT